MPTNSRGYWVSAKNVVYFNSAPVPAADAASFQMLNETWAKDSKHVYSVGRRIAKADVDTFQALNHLYARDTNNCYYLGGIIKGADAASFQVLDDGVRVREYRNGFGDHVNTDRSYAGFATDEHNVFHYVLTIGKPSILKKADCASFQPLRCGFARDKQNVYFENALLKGADSPSFEVVPPLWGKDKKSVYYGGTCLAGADPHCFCVLSSRDYLATDGIHYYDRQQEVSRKHAFPHGSAVPGFPLSWEADPAVAADYIRRGATPHDRLALNAACRVGNAEMVRLLLNAGCDPKITDEGHNSCLTELTSKNDLEIAILLIEAGANPNHMVEYSPAQHGPGINAGALHHPLEQALFQKRFDLADYLISVGADINAKTGEGYRLIDYFRRLNNKAAVDYLLNKGAFCTS